LLLGLLCRQSDFASIARWAKRHWDKLRPALGCAPGRNAPHATTLARACELLSVSQFQHLLLRWLSSFLDPATFQTAAVDGKTSKQTNDADGDLLHILNVFVHDVKIALGQWAVGAGKETEPEVLKAHLAELFDRYPALQLLTGDALFAQRPLAQLILEHGRDYLVGLKDNQPDLSEAATTAFADETAKTAEAGTRAKKNGAVVTRRLWLDIETADYGRETLSYAGLRILARVDCEQRRAGVVESLETRYFAYSLEPATITPAELLELIRGHWQVEGVSP